MRDNNIRDVRQISLQGFFVWGTIAPNVDLMLMIYIYIYIYIPAKPTYVKFTLEV